MELDLKYLDLLSEKFPTVDETTTEIMNLEAILNLPKGTEHFVSDLHGEYEAFEHVLRSGSGNVRRKIEDLFQYSLSGEDMDELATLVSYPREKTTYLTEKITSEYELEKWYFNTLDRLIDLAVFSSTKYTRSKVRKAIPQEYSYIIGELLFRDNDPNKEDYYQKIISSMIELDRVEDFIEVIAKLIQRLVVDHLHVVGDIYDRGPHPEKIIERLKNYHSVDIQWGNHDTLWMGAASGSAVCVAAVIRICSRYDNLEILEDAYGISMRQLILYANEVYTGEVPETFYPKADPYKEEHHEKELEELSRLQQAIAIIQFKLEKAVIDRQPDFGMEDRLLLEAINFENNTIEIEGVIYDLIPSQWPTIDPTDPTRLTDEEQSLINNLVKAFIESEQLQSDIRFMVQTGQMYLSYNSNLLYHGCVPLEENGDFSVFEYKGKKYSGKSLMEFFDEKLRDALIHHEEGDSEDSRDLMWYLWSGNKSPIFGKHAMTTFERYFIDDESIHTERKNPYYDLREDEVMVEKILAEFGLDPKVGHIVNGHTPVKERNGENPMKANRRMLVIDGGFSKAYHSRTGIGGYTLLYNSYGLELATHKPFTDRQDAVENDTDILSTKRVVDRELERKKVRDTDNGRLLREQSDDLKQLLKAYRTGRIQENLD